MLLTVNTGSSSLKVAVYPMEGPEQAVLTAHADRIGLPGGRLRVLDETGRPLVDRQEDFTSHGAALQAVFVWVERRDAGRLRAAGHRIVHGGSAYSVPQPVTQELAQALRDLIPIDPNHLPQAIEAIEAVGQKFPSMLQVACFDTAFHRHMPRVAQIYALPRHFEKLGVVRYGFHGLSYEYIMQELSWKDPALAAGRIVIAHLGNGSSMAAVRQGRGMDTTMGFSPTGGLVMGTRSGDLDPAVLLYLMQGQRMSPDELNSLVNRQSGLLGVSGTSGDMQDLLQRGRHDAAAAEAVDLFCYQARKYLGALVTALGGLDLLVFTGGIGEHAAPVRERICANLEFLGLQLDPQRNNAHDPVVSTAESRVVVRVMQTNEDLMIARHTARVLDEIGEKHVHV